jgi:hypothetical protein
VSTTQAAIDPSSDVNHPMVRTYDVGGSLEESPGRGDRPDGTAEVPDRQLRVRQV